MTQADNRGDPRVDRRAFLRRLAGRGTALAAGAAAASALVPEVASAGDGSNIIIGSGGDANNTGTTTTTLTGSQLSLVDGNSSQSLAASHIGAAATAFSATASGSSAVAVRTTANFGAGLRVGPDAGGVPMPPAGGNWTRGSMRTDDDGTFSDLWYCYADGSGTASGWYPLSLVPAFVPLAAPQRIYDSRPGVEPLGVQKGLIAPEQDRTIDSLFGSFVPPTAFGVLMNLAVTSTFNSGWLGVFPSDQAYPGNASINWFGSGQNLSNAVTTLTDVNGDFDVHCGGGSTHFVIDVVGFYTLTA